MLLDFSCPRAGGVHYFYYFLTAWMLTLRYRKYSCVCPSNPESAPSSSHSVPDLLVRTLYRLPSAAACHTPSNDLL